jgi:hypothetical protein
MTLWTIRNIETEAFIRDREGKIAIFSSRTEAEDYVDREKINRKRYYVCIFRR